MTMSQSCKRRETKNIAFDPLSCHSHCREQFGAKTFSPSSSDQIEECAFATFWKLKQKQDTNAWHADVDDDVVDVDDGGRSFCNQLVQR